MKDNKYLIPVLLIATIIVTIMGGTLAYWNWQTSNAQKTNVTFTIGANFSCGADGGGDITSNTLAPTDCTNTTYAIQRTVTTSLTNNSGEDVYMDMWLNINSIGSGLTNSNNFRYALTTSPSSCTTGLITQGNFKGKVANDKVILLGNVTSASTYYLYIWLDAAETDVSTQNQSVSLSLGGECTNEKPQVVPSFIRENAVMDNINSTYVSNATPGIKWDEIASDTNGKGIYIRSGTENNENPIYYYRGAVDNNNVYFGGFCWKIVRTTETGGLKMIYNGVPTSGSCGSGTTSQSGASSAINNSVKYNASNNNAKYVGYTYDNSGVETDSTIKGVIDTWYQNNLLTNYDSYLEDTVFCNDKSTHTSSEFTSAEQSAFSLTNSSYTYYGSTYRLAKKLGPSVTCPNSSDAYTKSSTIGNGKLTYPVGLLTSDEIWMAGEGTYYYGTSGTGYGNTTYYLQNNNYWWSLSPRHWNGSRASVWFADSSDGLYGNLVDSSFGARPVVSLKPGQNFGYGNGTTSNPYRFVETVS